MVQTAYYKHHVLIKHFVCVSAPVFCIIVLELVCGHWSHNQCSCVFVCTMFIRVNELLTFNCCIRFNWIRAVVEFKNQVRTLKYCMKWWGFCNGNDEKIVEFLESVQQLIIVQNFSLALFVKSSQKPFLLIIHFSTKQTMSFMSIDTIQLIWCLTLLVKYVLFWYWIKYSISARFFFCYCKS